MPADNITQNNSSYRNNDEPQTQQELPSIWMINWKVFQVSLPVVISYLSFQIILVTNTIYAGKIYGELDEDASKIAGIGVGMNLVQSVLLSFLVGLNGALVTQVAQAYGANMSTLSGIYLNRARLITTVLFIPLSVLVIFGSYAFDHASENHKNIELAQNFIKLCLPGVYFLSMFDMTRGILNCFEVTWVPMLI